MYRLIFRLQGDVHEDIQVVQNRQVRYLRFGNQGGWQGALDLNRPERPVFPYQRAFLSLVRAIPSPQRFLSLGVGTGTALKIMRRIHPAAELYGVELDAKVIDVAVAFFDCPGNSDVQYWVGDGVVFLSLVRLTFDLIYVDMYLSDRVYSPCVTPDFASTLAAAAGQDGLVVCNLILSWPPSGMMREFLQTACQEFAEVWLLPVGVPWAEQNVLAVFCASSGRLTKWREQLRTCPQLAWHERWLWPLRLRRC